MVMFSNYKVALYLGSFWGEGKECGTHCMCMHLIKIVFVWGVLQMI